MWYVVQVRTGTEENIRIQCERRIPRELLTECFIPYYEEPRKIDGEWIKQKKVLFPGYVFAVTDDVEELFLQLKAVSGLTKLIGAGEDIIALTDGEREFIESFGGDEKVVEMSTGIIEGDRIIVQTGPLMGREGYIKKIDRHKRKAWLEFPMFGSMQRVQVGLEIVAKTG